MPNNRVGRIVQQLQHVAALTDAHTSDGQLLATFIAERDEAAFAALVRRYGQMVLGVCHRVLRHTADADDAFQAAFLVLVRRAAQVRSRASLGNWLYGVAYRTALHARKTIARRRRLEGQVRPMERDDSPTDAAMHSELQQLLDQELNALPEKYRAVIVLCDLLGNTKREAAQQLRCPEGTVSSRLTRGRELLRKRLTRRGAALSLGTLAALLETNKAPASASLIETTIKTAALVAAGNLMAAGGIAPNAAGLMEGVLKSMLLVKLKIATAVLFVTVLLGSGLVASAFTYQTPAEESNTTRQASQIKRDKEAADTPDTKEQTPPPSTKAPPTPVDPASAGRIRVGDILDIQTAYSLPEQPIHGLYQVEPSGKVALRYIYGRVDIKGLTLEEAEAVIRDHLSKYIKDVKEVSVTRPITTPKSESAVRELESRVDQLEREVRELRSVVETLRKKPRDGN
jgi:RNA polymerase sigma factor (sigma-70 family)